MRGGTGARSAGIAALLTLAGAGCRRGQPEPPPEQPASQANALPPEAEAPVAVNADSPIQYPPALFDQKIEGEVVLRLFVDSTGRLRPESTKVAESSGYPGLDSAAVAGSAKLRFAPARRHGLSAATTFLQPIEFRHPQGAVLKGGP